jgi:hypothetical protein
MFSRRFLFGSLLLLQAAFSLLGNAGVHTLLGCQHEHGPTATRSAPQATASHTHRGCNHVHCHSHTTPAGDPQNHSHPPLTDDDCAICQFFTRPVEAAVAFQWAPGFTVVSMTDVESTEQPGVPFESVYEVRGPPAAA